MAFANGVHFNWLNFYFYQTKYLGIFQVHFHICIYNVSGKLSRHIFVYYSNIKTLIYTTINILLKEIRLTTARLYVQIYMFTISYYNSFGSGLSRVRCSYACMQWWYNFFFFSSGFPFMSETSKNTFTILEIAER